MAVFSDKPKYLMKVFFFALSHQFTRCFLKLHNQVNIPLLLMVHIKFSNSRSTMSEDTLIRNTIVGTKDKLRDTQSFFPAKLWGYQGCLRFKEGLVDHHREY